MVIWSYANPHPSSGMCTKALPHWIRSCSMVLPCGYAANHSAETHGTHPNDSAVH